MSTPVAAVGRDTSRPLPFFPAARGIYGLALEGMSGAAGAC